MNQSIISSATGFLQSHRSAASPSVTRDPDFESSLKQHREDIGVTASSSRQLQGNARSSAAHSDPGVRSPRGERWLGRMEEVHIHLVKTVFIMTALSDFDFLYFPQFPLDPLGQGWSVNTKLLWNVLQMQKREINQIDWYACRKISVYWREMFK